MRQDAPLHQPMSIDAIVEAYARALDDFLVGPRRNQHIVAGPIKTYLRKSFRPGEGRVVKALDLAGIEIEPAFQRKGLAGHILDLLEEKNPFPVLFVESVVNKDFEAFLARRGYLIERQDPGTDITTNATIAKTANRPHAFR